MDARLGCAIAVARGRRRGGVSGADELANPHFGAGAELIDQAIFGYDGGHRLLGASTTLDSDTLAVLSRLTDGTGAESYTGFDGYLSGYPLPDERYALTRTWRAAEASRPGAVWTHALLIDKRVLATVKNPRSFTSEFRRPSENEFSERYKQGLRIEPDLALSSIGHLEQDWRSALSGLYARDDGTVWLPSDEGAAIEGDVLQIWWWQWPTLRQRFSFCLGATGRRSLGGRGFDLLVVPAARRLSAVADLGPPPSDTTAAGTLIDADLRGRMPEAFRSYLRFCGSETQRRSAAGLLSDIWMAADDPDGDPASIQRRLAARISGEYPRPSSMRRLKRTLLSPDERLPARWTRRDSAALLVSTDFAKCVRSSDVDVLDVVLALREEPGLLLEAARGVSRREWLGQRGSVAEVLPRFARDALAVTAEPSWLSEIAELGGEAALDVLFAVKPDLHESWSRAFWALDDEKRVSTSLALGERNARSRLQDGRSIAWIAAYAPTPAVGVRWLSGLGGSLGEQEDDLRVLASELARFSGAVRLGWRGSVRDELLSRALVEAATSSGHAGELALLLLIADPSATDIASAGLRPWRGLVEAVLGPVEAAHILRIAGDPEVDGESVLAGRAFAVVWEACARSDWVVWEALGSYPSVLGFGADWDRARRVSRRFAEQLLGWRLAGNSGRDQARGEVRRISRRAAEQLDEEVRNLTGSQGRVSPRPPGERKKSKGGKKGKTPLDEARRLAADWLWPM